MTYPDPLDRLRKANPTTLADAAVRPLPGLPQNPKAAIAPVRRPSMRLAVCGFGSLAATLAVVLMAQPWSSDSATEPPAERAEAVAATPVAGAPVAAELARTSLTPLAQDNPIVRSASSILDAAGVDLSRAARVAVPGEQEPGLIFAGPLSVCMVIPRAGVSGGVALSTTSCAPAADARHHGLGEQFTPGNGKDPNPDRNPRAVTSSVYLLPTGAQPPYATDGRSGHMVRRARIGAGGAIAMLQTSGSENIIVPYLSGGQQQQDPSGR